MFEQCILNISLVRYNYPEHLLRKATGKSLRGHATNIVWYLARDAPLDAMLPELQYKYGAVIGLDGLMQNFYKLKWEK